MSITVSLFLLIFLKYVNLLISKCLLSSKYWFCILYYNLCNLCIQTVDLVCCRLSEFSAIGLEIWFALIPWEQWLVTEFWIVEIRFHQTYEDLKAIGVHAQENEFIIPIGTTSRPLDAKIYRGRPKPRWKDNV